MRRLSWMNTRVEQRQRTEARILAAAGQLFGEHGYDRTTIRAAEAFAYHSSRISSTPDLYQPEVLARIRSGADVSAPAYIEARRRMERLRREGHYAFETVDVLVTRGPMAALVAHHHRSPWFTPWVTGDE